MTTQPTGRVDISPDHVAEVFAELDSLYMEAAEDSPTERAALEAMSVLEALRSALTARDDALASIRIFAQDCIENGHDRGSLGNLYSIRDLCDSKGETK